jgi:uncharacterized protein YbjQ (UPF0145 family)
MGFFSKESRNLCYFCNNDYFQLFKTIDNNYVCKDCIGNDGLTEEDIQLKTLDEIIKERESLSLSKMEVARRDTFCSACNKYIASGSKDYVSLMGIDYCKSCASHKIKSIDSKIILTAANELVGYKIEKHLDLICVESLMNLGYNMNYESQSLLGRPSSDKDMKFKEAKNAALLKLKMEAFNLGGDAVIGFNISSTVFYDKRSVVASGTVVKTRVE